VPGLELRLAAPSLQHPFGTDHLARDVFSRLLYGARISLSIAFFAVALSVSIGTFLGALSGFVGGRTDRVIMGSVDAVLAFPRIVLILTLIAVFEASIPMLILVLGLTQWPGTARMVRAEVLSLREREFIQAVIALGFGRMRILVRHLIPNALGPVIVTATLGIGNTIVLEAGLSFLGFGVPSPTASWGTMLNDGRGLMGVAWWVMTFPGLAIVLTVVAFNMVGDGLRDALDPRMR
jgi:peptide/nickel transport system permease protein